MASFFFSSRRRHTRSKRDWSSDVCSSDLGRPSTYRLPKMAATRLFIQQENGANSAPFVERKGAREEVKGCTGPPERVHTGAGEPSKAEPSNTETDRKSVV